MSAHEVTDMSLVASKSSQQRASEQAIKTILLVFEGWMINPKRIWARVLEHQRITMIWIDRFMELHILTIKGEYKTFASIISPWFSGTAALSGWADDHTYLPIIESSIWTNKVSELASAQGVLLPDHEHDSKYGFDGKGKFHASHAETKLMAFFETKRQAQSWAEDALCLDFTTLNINVSREPCGTCQEFARRLYQKRGLMVNFTFESRLVVPICRNDFCQQPMKDGRRVYCNRCQSEVDSGIGLAIYLPQIGKAGSKHKSRIAALDASPRFSNIYDNLKELSAVRRQGIELCLEEKVFERNLIVIIPPSRATGTRETSIDTINYFKEYALRPRSLGLRYSAREKILALKNAVGNEVVADTPDQMSMLNDKVKALKV